MKYIINALSIFTVLVLVISCQQQNTVTQEEAKLLCDKVEVMYNDADSETAIEILDSTYVLYSPLFPMGLRGIDVLMYNIKSNARSFPDFKITVDSFFVKDDMIYSFWTQKGTNTGPLGRMPSTGKSIDVSGFAISRVKDGKIFEEHTYWNVLEFYKQLGFQVVPPDFENL
ncbi:MAG: ester cyclase [Ignavibacteria bacterium]|nr:ester cyclase [Ignavibacteria bacterium]